MTFPTPNNPWLNRRDHRNWQPITDPTDTIDRLDFSPMGTVARLQMLDDAKRRGIVRQPLAATFKPVIADAISKGLATHAPPASSAMPISDAYDSLAGVSIDGAEADSTEALDASESQGNGATPRPMNTLYQESPSECGRVCTIFSPNPPKPFSD